MKKSLLIGSILFFSLVACMSSANIATATVGIPDPTVDEERVMEMTRENSVIQTIVALQQLTNTPTPGGLVNLPKPWTEIVTTTTTLTPQTTTLTPFPNSAVAAVINPNTPIKQGPGNNYKTACFVDERSQLKIIGRNNDSTWLRVTFSLGQTCYTLVNSVITEIIPDPTMQFWILHSACTIFGDLSKVAIVTPAATPTATRYFLYTPGIPTATHQPGGPDNPTATNTPIPPPTNTPEPPPSNTPEPPTPTEAPTPEGNPSLSSPLYVNQWLLDDSLHESIYKKEILNGQ